MPLDGWVVPPAVAAAVFTVMAIAPPGGPVARGLRVEAAQHVRGLPWLVRVAVDEPGTSRWHAPHDVRLALHTDAGTTTRVTAMRTSPGARYVFAAIDAPASTMRPWLTVDAEGFTARAALVDDVPVVPIEATTPGGDQGVDVAIEGGVLAPEVTARVGVRVRDGAGHAVSVAPSDDTVTVAPTHATLDACGIAQFDATARGFDAHVAITVGGVAEHVVHRRLAVLPGAFVLRGATGALSVTAAVANQPVFLVAGDASGPRFWTEGLVSDPSGENATTVFPLDPSLAWAVVSHATGFDQPQGLWLADTRETTRCTDSPLAAWFDRIARAAPAPPRVHPLFDGAASALLQREQRKDHARRIALRLALASIAVLIAFVLRAGLRRDPAGLETFSARPRQRALFTVAAAAALLVGALVLLTAYVLRF